MIFEPNTTRGAFAINQSARQQGALMYQNEAEWTADVHYSNIQKQSWLAGLTAWLIENLRVRSPKLAKVS